MSSWLTHDDPPGSFVEAWATPVAGVALGTANYACSYAEGVVKGRLYAYCDRSDVESMYGVLLVVIMFMLCGGFDLI
jgi:hypothetical protein